MPAQPRPLRQLLLREVRCQPESPQQVAEWPPIRCVHVSSSPGSTGPAAAWAESPSGEASVPPRTVMPYPLDAPIVYQSFSDRKAIRATRWVVICRVLACTTTGITADTTKAACLVVRTVHNFDRHFAHESDHTGWREPSGRCRLEAAGAERVVQPGKLTDEAPRAAGAWRPEYVAHAGMPAGGMPALPSSVAAQ